MKKLLIVIAVLVVVVPGGLVLVGLAFGHTKVRTHTVAGPIREIVVKSGSGDVDLLPADGRVQVRETRHYVFKQPTLEQDVTNGVLTLEADCSSLYFNCSTDLRVTVPAGIEVKVEADSGNIHAGGIGVHDIHAQSDSGDVHLALAGRQSLAWAHTDSGDVHVQTAGARAVDARTDSGDVRVETRGETTRVVAQTDSGDVDVDVPAGEYAVDTDTDSGDVEIDGISRNDRAPRTIEAHTDSGDIKLDGS
jgi:DUF4097 and DUF4098 domain-containing protein YvlB